MFVVVKRPLRDWCWNSGFLVPSSAHARWWRSFWTSARALHCSSCCSFFVSQAPVSLGFLKKMPLCSVPSLGLFVPFPSEWMLLPGHCSSAVSRRNGQGTQQTPGVRLTEMFSLVEAKTVLFPEETKLLKHFIPQDPLVFALLSWYQEEGW